MAKKKENKEELELFTSQITKDNKKGLLIYAAKKDLHVYEALNEVIKKGLQN
jgi:hypothetical protein